jgi:heme exporter protein D
MNHFFAMGGYGFYVWSAYSMTFLVFFINLILSITENKKIKKRLKQHE